MTVPEGDGSIGTPGGGGGGGGRKGKLVIACCTTPGGIGGGGGGPMARFCISRFCEGGEVASTSTIKILDKKAGSKK